ncbi:MAG: hypothetical protein WCT03_14830 [Candidatus Obscuribacterales bacterium]
MTVFNQPEIATSQREVTEREAGQQASEAAARLQSEAAREMAAQGSRASGKPLPAEGPEPPQQPPSESSNGGMKSDWKPPQQDNH